MSDSGEGQRKVRNNVGVPCGMNEYWLDVMYASFFQKVLVGQLDWSYSTKSRRGRTVELGRRHQDCACLVEEKQRYLLMHLIYGFSQICSPH